MRLVNGAACAISGFVNSVAMAAPANAWPSGMPAAHAWFMCSNPQGDAFVAWVDATHTVTAVGALREGMPVPSIALPMLHDSEGNRHHIQRTTAGFRLAPQGTLHPIHWTIQVEAAELTCGHARDE